MVITLPFQNGLPVAFAYSAAAPRMTASTTTASAAPGGTPSIANSMMKAGRVSVRKTGRASIVAFALQPIRQY